MQSTSIWLVGVVGTIALAFWIWNEAVNASDRWRWGRPLAPLLVFVGLILLPSVFEYAIEGSATWEVLKFSMLVWVGMGIPAIGYGLLKSRRERTRQRKEK